MRTVSSASSNVASGEEPAQVFYDTRMRNSKQKVINTPSFVQPTRIADTHAHLDMLHHPELALFRAAALGVDFIVSVIDPTEDPLYTMENLSLWQRAAQELLNHAGAGEELERAQAEEIVRQAQVRAGQRPTEGGSGHYQTEAGAGHHQAEGHAGAGQSQDQADAQKNQVGVGVEKSVAGVGAEKNQLLAGERQSQTRTGGAPERGGVALTQEDFRHRVPEVALIMGCHPHNASSYTQKIEDLLCEALKTDTRMVGIGEIGLDYHYDNSPRDVQKAVFRRQLQLAHEHQSLVALHLREAHADGLRILREVGVPEKGLLLHCFNLDYATLEPFLEMGAMVAFGGPLTFKKAVEVRDAAARTPLNKLVTETDCPFMAPEPIRGTICEPASVVYTAKVLEGLREESLPLDAIYQNARDFFVR